MVRGDAQINMTMVVYKAAMVVHDMMRTMQAPGTTLSRIHELSLTALINHPEALPNHYECLTLGIMQVHPANRHL